MKRNRQTLRQRRVLARKAEEAAAEAERRVKVAPRGIKLIRLAECRLARTAALALGGRAS